MNINQSLSFTKKIKQLSLLNPPKTNSPKWNLIVVLQLELVATRLIVAVLNCCVKFSCHGYRVDNIDLISFLLFSIRTRRSLISKQKSDIRYILVKTDSHCPVKYCCYLDFVWIKSWLSHLSSRIAWELPKVLDTQLNFLSGSLLSGWTLTRWMQMHANESVHANEADACKLTFGPPPISLRN